MMAMLSYRSHPAYSTKFGRTMTSSSQRMRFDVEEYLQYQGVKFLERGFDAAAYVRLTQAMDSHDVSRGRGEYFEVLRNVKVPVLVASVSSDVLYPVSEQLELATHLPDGQHHLIESDEGHDGFLLEARKMGTLIRGFLGELE